MLTQLVDYIGVPDGIRTRVTAVKGRCPGPLDDGDAAVEGKRCGPRTSAQEGAQDYTGGGRGTIRAGRPRSFRAPRTSHRAARSHRSPWSGGNGSSTAAAPGDR